VRTKRYKLIYFYGDGMGQPGALDERKEPEWELFDLEKDPHELHNLYHQPEYAEVAKELRAELRRLQEEVGDEPYAEERV
jgi:arylsulfatase A-like enzyme